MSSIENHAGYKHALERLRHMLKCQLADIPTWARRKLALMCDLAVKEGGRSEGHLVDYAIQVSADVQMGLGGQRGLATDEANQAKAKPEVKLEAAPESALNIDDLVGGKSALAAMTYRKAALEKPEQAKRVASRPSCNPDRKARLLHALNVCKGKAPNDIQSPVTANA